MVGFKHTLWALLLTMVTGLDRYLLKREDPLCVSNEVKGEYAIIENSGNILLIQSRDA